MRPTSAAKHFSVLSLVEQGYSYHQIHNETSISLGTISKIGKEVDANKENNPGGHPSKFFTCQDPNTKSSLLRSNGSTICYLPFILGIIFYYCPYYSLPASFHSILVCLLIGPSCQHCYTWIIKYQLWLCTDFILSKQWMFHLETQHSRLLYCYFLFYHFIYVSLLSKYIILSFVLCTLVLKINLVSPILLLLSSPGFPPLYYWRFPSYVEWDATSAQSPWAKRSL